MIAFAPFVMYQLLHVSPRRVSWGKIKQIQSYPTLVVLNQLRKKKLTFLCSIKVPAVFKWMIVFCRSSRCPQGAAPRKSLLLAGEGGHAAELRLCPHSHDGEYHHELLVIAERH